VNLILVDTQNDRYQFSHNDARHRHIRKILKANPGDTLHIGVVDGPEGIGTIRSTDADGTIVEAIWSREMRPSLPIHVAIGHPRPPVLQRLWRDLAAMRVASIHVFSGDLSERSYFDSSIWHDVDARVRDGLSQGKHTARPEIRKHAKLVELFDEIPRVRYGYYGAISNDLSVPLYSAVTQIADRHESPVVVCIGPERGLSDREHTLLEEYRFVPVSLGNAVLRTETATIGILVGIASVFGENENRAVKEALRFRKGGHV
jgi:16S rRNA (uracil1498-N3)-methyltransferase